MKLSLLTAMGFVAVAGLALAEGDAGRRATEASEALGRAAESLAAAGSASDRIAALTETIRAYEAGLAAMREGLREAALNERDAAARLAAQDAELGELLALLQKVTRAGQARSVLHPGGAVQTVRAGILGSALVPALEERSAALESDFRDLVALRTVQEAGIDTLTEGLDQVREARLMLSQAISERTDLPPPAATDEAAMQALINSSETLAGFADSLASTGDTEADSGAAWSMPVAGRLLRAFDEADAAGVRRPGWVIGTAAEALVTAQEDATVRFSGDLPGHGPVVILETDPGRLVILAGQARNFVRRAQIVAQGEPIALMGAGEPAAQENLIESSLLGGQPRDETLYIEIRQGQAPVDPAAFLRPSQE
jgi:septal ring factor EnvC (AmiA/AmiB activator)